MSCHWQENRWEAIQMKHVFKVVFASLGNRVLLLIFSLKSDRLYFMLLLLLLNMYQGTSALISNDFLTPNIKI